MVEGLGGLGLKLLRSFYVGFRGLGFRLLGFQRFRGLGFRVYGV